MGGYEGGLGEEINEGRRKKEGKECVVVDCALTYL